MAAPVALIQGASRGLGFGFCKYILKNKSLATVVATCRNPDGAAELRSLAGQHPGRLMVLRLDVNHEEDIRGAAERVKESFGRLDLVVNSSAMLHSSGKGETSLRDVSAQVDLCFSVRSHISVKTGVKVSLTHCRESNRCLCRKYMHRSSAKNLVRHHHHRGIWISPCNGTYIGLFLTISGGP